jgi:hypothetical protein
MTSSPLDLSTKTSSRRSLAPATDPAQRASSTTLAGGAATAHRSTHTPPPPPVRQLLSDIPLGLAVMEIPEPRNPNTKPNPNPKAAALRRRLRPAATRHRPLRPPTVGDVDDRRRCSYFLLAFLTFIFFLFWIDLLVYFQIWGLSLYVSPMDIKSIRSKGKHVRKNSESMAPGCRPL